MTANKVRISKLEKKMTKGFTTVCPKKNFKKQHKEMEAKSKFEQEENFLLDQV